MSICLSIPLPVSGAFYNEAQRQDPATKIGRHSRCNVLPIALLYRPTTAAKVTDLSVAPTTLRDEAESTLDLHIDELIAENESTTARPQTFERRRKPRLQEAFPARVSGVDSRDLPFYVDCVLDNISATGLYLRTPKFVDAGSEVRLIVYLLNGPTQGATAALQGCILRSELQADGKHGLAIAIRNHWFL